MERGKSGMGRGGKSKLPQHPSEVYALGSKAGNETKRTVPVPHPKPGTSHSLPGDRKREGVASSSLIPPKKAKVGHSSAVVSGGVVRSSPVTTPDNSDAWETNALDFEPADFITLISDASNTNDHDKIIGYICGAVKTLKQQRYKPDASLIQSLIYLSKIKSPMFTNELITSALCSVLRRDTNHSFKSKNALLPVLAANLLMRGYLDNKRWPEIFVKLLIEDSLGERLWVDHENCKSFVENVMTAFNTKATPALELENRLDPAEDPDAATLNTGPSSAIAKEIYESIPVVNRFTTNQEAVETAVLEVVRENLSRRQAPDSITRNFLKLLAAASGIIEVRVLVASRLEVWLQNPKLQRPAQELLMSVCVNCTGHTQKDVEVISALVKIRLKSKAILNYYLACVRELITAHLDNLGTVLKHTIYNELSQSRNPNNLSMLAVMFQYDPDMAAAILADIFQELLLNRDDYLRPLRALLREIWRALRSDLNLAALSRGLMSQTEPLPRDCEFSQRAFTATADLITLCMFLAVATYARPDKKEPQATLEKMQQTVAGIQNDAVWWLQETALRIYRPSASDFVHALHKVLLMEQLDQYYKLDNWPPESDRMQFMRLASEVPLLQNILLRVLMIGLSKEHPLAAAEALELADQLVKRSANIASSDNSGHVLIVDKLEIFDLIFNLSAYHHPENIDLPIGYKPPTLAITNLYWKGWALLLVLSAHNPTTVGAEGWNKYPTLQTLMKMCITNHFIFPQAPEELQLLTLEKEAILQFETHLAAASTKMEITEQSSLLLSQLMSMNVKGESRRPPPIFIDQLVNLNSSLRLGHLLCRSRQPDFLLDIIQLQGPSQSMPWLADLVHSSDASLNHLPVQCLCEFVLSSGARQQHKYQQLLTHLQNLLTEPTQDAKIVCEILDYFLRRLSSPRNREHAIAGLKLVLGCAEEELEDGRDDASWLMRQLPLLPHFAKARTQIVIALRDACLIESEPSLVVMYLNFLAQHSSTDLSEMTDLVADMATLIVERSTIINAIVPSQDEPNLALDAFLSIFYSYLIKAREPQREAYTWSESQDQILVTWLSGEQCTLYILVVHAMVIILSFGPQAVTLAAEYQNLLDAWFPVDRDETPKAFLVDTSEEALLIPDWLKLRMIRSRVPRLVNAALTDLEPQQLILFIQSFGIPVASMSKLLETLDHAVLTDELAVGEAVQDKAYMTQLVEVQHRRGAVGGDIFSRVLGGQDKPEPTPSGLPTPMDVTDEPIPSDLAPTLQLTETKIIPVVESLFLLPEDRQVTRGISLTLQKTLSSELTKSRTSKEPSRVLKVLIIYLMKRTSSDKNFVRAIISRPHVACPLFRLLTSVSRQDLLPTLLLIAKVILSEAQAVIASKPLVNILKTFINKHESSTMSGLRTRTSSGDMIKVFEEAPLLQLESRGRSLLESPALRVHGPETLVQALTSLLLRNDKATNNRKGLLTDWLVQLQPEIIGTASKAQLDLLFSRGEFSCRPYLLTLLAHHASWGTINLCVKQLLDPNVVTIYDPSSVLEFLIALTCNPKLLQGREKFALKNGAREDILGLPLHQLMCIADYVVEEAVRMDDIKVAVDKMNLRLCLLAPQADLTTLSALVSHLSDNTAKPTGKHSEMCRQLLVQLYLRVPSIITQLSNTELTKYLSTSPISVMGSSVLDSMSHTLLTALTATPPSKDWVRRSQDLDLAARKMTATHPLLVLRQLTMLSSALRGRVHLEFPVFRSRNHLTLFNQVLGLLELLKPHLFRSEYTPPLHATFDTYFQLFKRYGHMKDVAAMLNRFVNLLKAYIGHNAEEALRYLQTQAQLISELQNQHHSLGSVCIMMSGVRDRESVGGGEVLVSAPTPPDSLPPQWDNILLALKHSDALSSLQELDQVTLRRPGLLAQTVNDLCELIQSPSSAARSLAHGLLARYLRHAPDTALTLLPAYLACLHSGNCELVTSLLDRLPEIIVCSQEVAQPLLETVFGLGLTQNVSTLQSITKSLSLINLQIGC